MDPLDTEKLLEALRLSTNQLNELGRAAAHSYRSQTIQEHLLNIWLSLDFVHLRRSRRLVSPDLV